MPWKIWKKRSNFVLEKSGKPQSDFCTNHVPDLLVLLQNILDVACFCLTLYLKHDGHLRVMKVCNTLRSLSARWCRMWIASSIRCETSRNASAVVSGRVTPASPLLMSSTLASVDQTSYVACSALVSILQSGWLVVMCQGDHLTGIPGNVGEFASC